MKYFISVLTNISFVASGLVHLFYWGNPFIALGLFLIAIGSGGYHYYVAQYHSMMKDELSWEKRKSTYFNMKKWQKFDITSIYFTIGWYPYTITGNPLWLLFMIPMLFLIFNKLEVVLPDYKPKSEITIGASMLTVFAISFWYISLPFLVTSIFAFGISLIFQFLGRMMEKEEDYFGHDVEHGGFHITSATGFSLLG